MVRYDALDKVVDYLKLHWGSSAYPLIDDSPNGLYISEEDFNPNYPRLQLVIMRQPRVEGYHNIDLKYFEQGFTLRLYARPSLFKELKIEQCKDELAGYQEEISRILEQAKIDFMKYKFSTEWRWISYARGFTKENYLGTSFDVTFAWYEVNDLFGNAINYIESIDIGRAGTQGMFTRWGGVIGVTWQHSETLILQEIPNGYTIPQNIGSAHVTGEIHCTDYDSMLKALYKQPVQVSGSDYFALEDYGKTNNPIYYTKFNFYDIKGLPVGLEVGAMYVKQPQLSSVNNVNDENLALWKVPFFASRIDLLGLGVYT
jgi:hypothetical protein